MSSSFSSMSNLILFFSYLRSAQAKICGSIAQLWEPLRIAVPSLSCLDNWAHRTVRRYHQATQVHCKFCGLFLSGPSWVWLWLRSACIGYQARLQSANISSYWGEIRPKTVNETMSHLTDPTRGNRPRPKASSSTLRQGTIWLNLHQHRLWVSKTPL